MGNDKKWAHVVRRPEEILPFLTPYFYKCEALRGATNFFHPTEPLTLLVVLVYDFMEKAKMHLPFSIFPSFATITPFLFAFLFAFQFESNPCMLNCHTTSV